MKNGQKITLASIGSIVAVLERTYKIIT